MLVWNRCFQIL